MSSKYTCERCLNEFSQKSHYDRHQKRKTPCKNNKGDIEEVVENTIVDKKLIINNVENTMENTMENTFFRAP